MFNQVLYSVLQNGDDGGGALACCTSVVCMIPGLLIGLVVLAGMWKVYAKAGQPGWASIIPIYNIIVWLQIVGRPVWWVLLMFVPFVGFVILIIVSIDLAKSFGKDELYGILLFILSPIMMIHLGFSDAQYVGPSAVS